MGFDGFSGDEQCARNLLVAVAPSDEPHDLGFTGREPVEFLGRLGHFAGDGGAEQRGARIGGTGDEGIDGIIDQDALGLDRIYVQAKRYKVGNNISREAIQAFVGALHGFGATRGVFLTTSAFTTHAITYAASVQSRVILIDGQRLVTLMIKYRVGVQIKRTYTAVEIDADFFD